MTSAVATDQGSEEPRTWKWFSTKRVPSPSNVAQGAQKQATWKFGPGKMSPLSPVNSRHVNSTELAPTDMSQALGQSREGQDILEVVQDNSADEADGVHSFAMTWMQADNKFSALQPASSDESTVAPTKEHLAQPTPHKVGYIEIGLLGADDDCEAPRIHLAFQEVSIGTSEKVAAFQAAQYMENALEVEDVGPRTWTKPRVAPPEVWYTISDDVTTDAPIHIHNRRRLRKTSLRNMSKTEKAVISRIDRLKMCDSNGQTGATQNNFERAMDLAPAYKLT
ncbi:hypothetical protein SARC_09160, partial [Sphaeroforma arctica JP610]